MAVELKVPTVGESVTEVQVGGWLVKAGERVERDQAVVLLETDKASMELPSPVSGTLAKVLKAAGSKVKPGELLGLVEEGAAAAAAAASPPPPAADRPSPSAPKPPPAAKPEPPSAAKPEPPPAAKPEPPPAAKPAPTEKPAPPPPAKPGSTPAENPAAAPARPASTPAQAGAAGAKVMPAAARLLAERGLKAGDVAPSGPGGRLLKEDVERAAGRPAPGNPPAARPAPAPPPAAQDPTAKEAPRRAAPPPAAGGRATETVPMSPLRRTVARRLVDAQRSAALLTTFNEVDMTAVVELRRSHGEAFQARHGVKLGIMSFFVKAVVDALGEVPVVNARIRGGEDGDEIVYHHYCDVGIAVGGGKGLVVPVIRNAERLSFAEIEGRIADFARRAQENRLALEELTGGTFTISNGGVYGSLLSTPIVNPPQSGVLGLHAIQERPVARGGQVVVRPMMYVALTYDHRLVDGREAVTFLKRVKECVESPPRILLEA